MKGESGLKLSAEEERMRRGSRHMSIPYSCCLLRAHHVSDTLLDVGKTIVRLDHVLPDEGFVLTEFIFYCKDTYQPNNWLQLSWSFKSSNSDNYKKNFIIIFKYRTKIMSILVICKDAAKKLILNSEVSRRFLEQNSQTEIELKNKT